MQDGQNPRRGLLGGSTAQVAQEIQKIWDAPCEPSAEAKKFSERMKKIWDAPCEPLAEAKKFSERMKQLRAHQAAGRRH